MRQILTRKRKKTLRTSLLVVVNTPLPSGETEVRTSWPGAERKDLR